MTLQKPIKRGSPARGQTRETARHEKEARGAADRVMARRPAGPLSPRAAAPLPGHAGPAQPLPKAARARLEQSFQTDLGHIRIHSGPSADALTAALRARAFAAGPHLVFSQDAFDPNNADGLRLLAHETAHALQQGGLIGAGTAQTSVQRQIDGDDAAPADPQADQQADLWTDLKARYQEAITSTGTIYDPRDAGYSADVQAIEDAIGDGVLERANANEASGRVAEELLSIPPETFRGRCLLLDVLVLTHEFAAAQELLLLFPTIEQSEYVREFGEYLIGPEGNIDTYVQTMLDPGGSPAIRRIWRATLARMRSYIFDLGTELPDESPAFAGAIRAIGDQPDLSLRMSQMQLVTVLHMTQLEDGFLATLQNSTLRSHVAEMISGSSDGLEDSQFVDFLVRLFAAARIVTPQLAEGANPEPPPPASYILGLLRAELTAPITVLLGRAQKATQAATWISGRTAAGHVPTMAPSETEGLDFTRTPAINRYLALITMAIVPTNPDSPLALRSREEAGLTAQPAPNLTPQQMAAEFFQRLPMGGDFLDRRNGYISALRDNRQALIDEYNALPMEPEPTGQLDLGPASSLLFALVWSDWLTDWLSSQDLPAQDSVATRRFEVAQSAGVLAFVYEHRGLREATEGVYNAEAAGVSYALIPQGYEEVTGADFSEITGETQRIYVVVDAANSDGDPPFLPVETSQLVDFYNAWILQNQVDALLIEVANRQIIAERRLEQDPWEEAEENQMTPEEARAAGIEMPEVNDINTLMEQARAAVDVPKKYVAEGGRIVKNANDPSSEARIQLRHPSQPALDGRAPPSGVNGPIFEDKFLLRQDGLIDQVYFWALPDMAPVLVRIFGIPELESITDRFLAAVPYGGEPAFVRLLQFKMWVEEQDAATQSQFSESVGGVFAADLAEQREALVTAQRRLTRVNRMIALDNMRDFLAAIGDRLESILLPEMFGEMIQSFANVVQPADDREVQVVTLLLEAAPEIERMVNAESPPDRPNYTAISYLLPPLALAVSYLQNRSVAGARTVGEIRRGEDMRVVRERLGTLEPFDPIFDDLDARYETVRGIMRTLLLARETSQEAWTLYASQESGLHSELASMPLHPESPHASFILSLWTSRDVSDASEGRWEWGEHAAEDNNWADADAPPAPLPETVPTGIMGTRDAIFYRILAVHEDFEFVPGFGPTGDNTASLRRPGSGLQTDPLGGFSPTTDLVTISVSYVRGTGDDMRFSPERRVTIQAKDIGLLTLLAAVVDSQSRNAQLQELGNTIRAVGELALDLAEFIPGYGQAIMVVRLAAQIVMAIENGEFDELKEALLDDPLAEMEQISSALINGLDGVSLWGFLFGSVIGSGRSGQIADALGDIAERADTRRREGRLRSVRGRARRGRFARLASALGNIGITLADSLFDARERLQMGIDSALGRISSSPALAPHVSRIDQYAIWVQMIGDATAMAVDMAGELTGEDANPEAAARAALAQAQEGFDPVEMSAAIGDMLGAVSQIELPDEIVPMDLLIEVVLELVMTRANRKVKFVYQALRMAGLDSLIASAIDEHILGGTAVDPNVYWRTEIRSKFDEPFRQGRDDFVAAMVSTLEGLFPGYDFSAPELPDTTIATTEGNIIELDGPVEQTTQGAESSDEVDAQEVGEITRETEGFNLQGDPRHPHPGLLPSAEGKPLQEGQRSALEAEFGHDLRHVRVHTDPGAQDFVTGAGAKALTSGSRIYLGPDVDMNATLGDHIFRHEISHVLQQTGPRPLDPRRQGSSQAIEGRAGRGLQLDQFREQAADQMAEDSVGRSAAQEGPMSIRARGPKSLAPFGQGDMLRVLFMLGREATGGDYVDRIAGHGTGLSRTNAQEATADAQRMLQEIRSGISGAHWRPRLSEDDRHIAHIRSDARDIITESRLGIDFNRMLGRAAVEVPERRRRPRNHYRLDGGAFANILTGYVFEKTGIRLDIDLAPTDRTRVRDVQIKSVHMGRLWSARRGSLYDAVKNDHVVTSGTHEVTFQQARAYLRARFPLPHKWKRSGRQLRLHEDDMAEIAEVRAARGPSRLDPANLPTWDDYRQTEGNGLGLRVSNHGVLSKSKARAMEVEEPDPSDPTGQTTRTMSRRIDNTERESHHVPQFLLAQFYAGRSGKPGVSPYGRNGDFWTPGYMVGTSVQTARPGSAQNYDGVSSSRETVDFRNLILGASDRGDGMPAVSLARRTHQKGGLHLPGAPSPDATPAHDDQSSITQGFYLASRHRAFLIEEVEQIRQRHPEGNASSADQAVSLDDGDAFRALVDRYQTNPDRTNDLQDATLLAMRKTYKLVTSNMLNWLDLALDQHEVPYYQIRLAEKDPNRAEDANDAYKVTGNWKREVKSALNRKNRQLFGAWYVADAWNG